MSITLDKDKARRRLDDAIRIANSSKTVPQEWEQITDHLSNSTSKTYIAFLGAALLAKATDGRVDPGSIKPESHRPESFSIRPLAHDVLVPASRGSEYPPFHLGTTGPEPMNNQPFFRYSHLDDIDRHGGGPWFDVLQDAVEKVNELDEDRAVLALAAYIRRRTRVYADYRMEVEQQIGSVGDAMLLLELLEGFMTHESNAEDRPLRLQAIVGGLVRASGARVSSQRLHDPSRHAPGDVHVPDKDNPWWVAEVKNKPLSQYEAEIFVERALEYETIQGVAIIVIHPDHNPIKRSKLSDYARQHGLLICVCESMIELLSFIIAHPRADRPTVERVSEAIATQLEEMNASTDSLEEWRSLFDSTGSA